MSEIVDVEEARRWNKLVDGPFGVRCPFRDLPPGFTRLRSAGWHPRNDVVQCLIGRKGATLERLPPDLVWC
jgi:hypothetical protein